MSRGFWGVVMVMSLALTAGSAYVLREGLSVPEPQPVPLRSVPPEEAPVISTPTAAAVQAATSTSTVVGSTVSSTKTAISSTASAPSVARSTAAAAPVAPGEKRNILFRLVRPYAKDVQIIADFNNWIRQPLSKKGKFWELSVPLDPGTYEYAFVVDGKRVRDPNNKQAGANGKSSVLTVKPIGDRP